MKNLKYLLTAFCILVSLHPLFSQSGESGPGKCASMIRVQQYFKKHPEARMMAEERTKRNPTGPNRALRINAIVTIPVVVHIVLPNPYIVTDADVQAQIDRLNLDYSGLNPDSTNVPGEFSAIRGHSQIRFCLAKRTPSGQLTSGIERRVSSVGSDFNATRDPIKYSADGGLDAWDPSKYLNYWVGFDATGNSILGYGQFPNSTIDPPGSDGVFISYQAWGTNPCYVLPQFNKGRTAVHETGHYLGLFHTWGDDGSSCTGDDFADLTTGGSTCSLPVGMFNPAGQGNTPSDIGDTPNQAGDTNGCPSTQLKTDGCSAASPGVMYQNFLDYSNDACLTMFTKKQVERMEWVLNNCRTNLTTSLGCQPPANPVSLDAAPVQSVNPGGFENSGCNTLLYRSVIQCPGNITPKVRIENKGLTTLTSVTVGYRINNGAAVMQTLTVNLPLGATMVATFSPTAVTSGLNQFKFFTSNPNGSPDQVPSNDTLIQNLTVLSTTTLPLQEGFESTTFPPPGWALDNYNGDFTWERKTPGRNGSLGRMFINNYDVDATDNIDDFISSRVSTTGFDSVVINFDLAHKNYSTTGLQDTLAVLITKDCGATYQTVYKKWGTTLATAGSSNNAYDDPADGDWRTEKIVLSGSALSTGQLSVVFRNISRYGNNIHIDNINITGKNTAPSFRDILVSYIISPAAVLCSNSVTPQVVVTNVGVDEITSFDVGYRIDAGAVVTQTFSQTLSPGASTTVTLAAVSSLTTPALFTAFTANPVSALGAGDALPSNDTLRRQISITGTMVAPLIEGFQTTTFPPANWAINNPDGGITWQRSNVGNVTSGSAYVNTFNYGAVGQRDELFTPSVSYSSADSVFLTFDVAATYRNTNVDTLTVLVTRDCGNTFATVYKKWGDQLRTIANSQSTEFTPATGQWRNERIDLSTYANQSPIQVVFRVSNNNSNNVFIDNVNITVRTFPEILRRRGYLIVPTAFRDNFTVWHYNEPTTLRYVNVYNASGQLVASQQFNGNAARYQVIEMFGKAAGSYLVRLGYEDESKNVAQWIIKF